MSLQAAEVARKAGEELQHLDYFSDIPHQTELEFENDGHFHYPSPLPCPATENNTVSGRLIRARSAPQHLEKKGPAVVLLHGWNGEQGYRLLFPWLGRRFAWRGLTTAMIELPYHGSRKPRSGPYRNFLSGDILHMMEATRQSIADIRGIVTWLSANGYGPIGLWGVSLGAWLGGLVACYEKALGGAVLVTPIPKIDQAIENLEFCRHIRGSLKGRDISPTELNLTEHRPRLAPGKILLVEAVYDLFAPAESVEELWRAWDEPDIWRVKHGHISVLFSIPIMIRTGRWLQERLCADGG